MLDALDRAQLHSSFRGRKRAAADVNWHVELAIEDAEATNVVAVIMRNDDRVDFGGIPPRFVQSRLNFAVADSRVKKKAFCSRVDKDTVAAASRLQTQYIHNANGSRFAVASKCSSSEPCCCRSIDRRDAGNQSLDLLAGFLALLSLFLLSPLDSDFGLSAF